MKTWKESAEEGLALYKSCRIADAEGRFVESVRLARNDNAPGYELATALNHLAMVYAVRAKYSDAENALREALHLVATGTTPEEHLQRALAKLHRIEILKKQEKFTQALSEIQSELDSLDESYDFYAAELWLISAHIHTSTKRYDKSEEAIDRFLELAERIGEDSQRICLDLVTGEPNFGPGWEEEDSDGLRDLETEYRERLIRSLILRAGLHLSRPVRARELIEEAVSQSDKLGDHQLQAQSLLTGAQLICTARDWAEGTKYCRRALDMAEKVFGANHPRMASYLTNTAMLTLMADGLPTALAQFERASKILEGHFGIRHPKYAWNLLVQSGLMPFLQADQKEVISKTVSVLSEALETMCDFYDDDHSMVMTIRTQLAETLIRAERSEEAEIHLRKVLEDATPLSDTNPYPLMACLSEMLKLTSLSEEQREDLYVLIDQSLSKLNFDNVSIQAQKVDLLRQAALVYSWIGNNEKAEELLIDARVTSQEVDPVLHHRCQEELIEFYMAKREHEKALAVLEQSTATTAYQRLSEDAQKALILMNQEKFAEAETSSLATLAELERITVENPEVFFRVVATLFDIYVSQGRLDDAVRIIGTFSTREDRLGGAVKDVRAQCLRLIADAYAEKRDLRAEGLYKEAIAAAEEVRGKSPGMLDMCLDSYTKYLASQRDLDGIRRVLMPWLQLRTEIFGADNFKTAIVMLNIAKLNIDHDLKLALEMSMRALAIFEDSQNVEFLINSLLVRIAVLNKTGRQAEAEELATRLTELQSKLAEQS